MNVAQSNTSAAVSECENQLTVTGELDASRPQTVLRLPSGRTVVLPTHLMLEQNESTTMPFAASAQAETVSRETVVPLVAESLIVGKQTVNTGTVRLRRSTEEFTGSVNVPLTTVGWQVERVPINAVLQDRPDIRQEGDTTIYPLVEERLIAKREYLLREEVRVTRVATTTERTATMPLTRDVLIEERDETAQASTRALTTPEDITVSR